MGDYLDTIVKLHKGKLRFYITYVIYNKQYDSIRENILPNSDLTETIFNTLKYLEKNKFSICSIYVTDRKDREVIGSWESDISTIMNRDVKEISNFLSNRELLIEFTDILNSRLKERITNEEDYYYV